MPAKYAASRVVLVTSLAMFVLVLAKARSDPPNPPAKGQPPSAAAKPVESVWQPTRPGLPADGPYGPGTLGSNPTSAFSDAAPAKPSRTPPSALEPLAYSASRSDAALRIEDLMRGAAALRAQGNYTKAIILYNEVLKFTPRYAEGYRQRALTLVRLGNQVQAQIDYNRFLTLDPHATARVRHEVTLFEQSGQARIGESEAASYSYGLPVVPPARAMPAGPLPVGAIVGTPILFGASTEVPPILPSVVQLAEARLSWAQDAFQRQDWDSALDWATRSNHDVPQARTCALIAQILFAQCDFKGAAVAAREAVALGPVVDWRLLYGYYGHTMPRFREQLAVLEEFVRQNPSSADGHFLLGYQQAILGNTSVAHAQLAIASVLEPTDIVATSLLAKDGVEIVSSRGGLAREIAPREGVEVARRAPPVSNHAPPAATPAPKNRSEVTR